MLQFLIFFLSWGINSYLTFGFKINPDRTTPLIDTEIIYASNDGTYRSGEQIILFYRINNKSTTQVKGTVAGTLSDGEKKIVDGFQKYVEVPPQQSKEILIKCKAQEAGMYSIYVRFRNANGKLSENSAPVAYALDKINVSLSRQPDFEYFWKESLEELKQISPDFKLVKKSELSTDFYTTYHLEMKSLDNLTIYGWYRAPRNKSNLPVILQLPSLGGSFQEVRSMYESPKYGIPYDFAALSLNIRGHGQSHSLMVDKEKFNEYITLGLSSKHSYVYRGALMDCIRAIDFLVSRPEINPKKIAVEGASQGGALSLMLAALDKRVSLIAPDVPFMCDINQLYDNARWYAKEINAFVQKNEEKGLTLWKVKKTLSYFDVKNFCDKIQAPVLMSVGLQDHTCPPLTSVAAYNKITTKKICYVYPFGSHEGGGVRHRKLKFEWIREQFLMP